MLGPCISVQDVPLLYDEYESQLHWSSTAVAHLDWALPLGTTSNTSPNAFRHTQLAAPGVSLYKHLNILDLRIALQSKDWPATVLNSHLWSGNPSTVGSTASRRTPARRSGLKLQCVARSRELDRFALAQTGGHSGKPNLQDFDICNLHNRSAPPDFRMLPAAASTQALRELIGCR